MPTDNTVTNKVIPIAYAPEKAAVACGRSRTRIFKAIRDQELCARKDGHATLIEVAELTRWIRSFPTIGRQPENNSPANGSEVSA